MKGAAPKCRRVVARPGAPLWSGASGARIMLDIGAESNSRKKSETQRQRAQYRTLYKCDSSGGEIQKLPLLGFPVGRIKMSFRRIKNPPFGECSRYLADSSNVPS